MFFFKTKFFFPCSVFSFKNSYTLTRSDVLFLQAKIISKNETVILKKANVFKALPASPLFSFKNKVIFVAAPFFKFNNSLLFSDPKIDSIFLQFEDNYFIRRNRQLILETFNKFFYYLYNHDTIKKNIFLYRFLKFIKERIVLTEKEFNSNFRYFDGE